MGLMDKFKGKAEELTEKAKAALGDKAEPAQQEAEKARDTAQDAMKPGQDTAEEETQGPW